MRIYELTDKKKEIGTLLYYDKEKTFIIELREDLDEWSAPLLFSGLVKKKIFTVPRDISLMWVRERIIPSGRQNINSILRNHRLKEYDEMKFLELSGGRCAQDDISIRRIEAFPGYVSERMKENLTDAFVSDDTCLICFFADDTARRIDLKNLTGLKDTEKILNNKRLFESCRVGTGGYYITFNDSIDIPAAVLRKEGEKLPVKRSDFVAFVRRNILDTAEACRELECSRQNISYMVRRDMLKPLKEDVMGNLYLKSDVIRNKW